jgi:hypothetical protein
MGSPASHAPTRCTRSMTSPAATRSRPNRIPHQRRGFGCCSSSGAGMRRTWTWALACGRKAAANPPIVVAHRRNGGGTPSARLPHDKAGALAR